MRLYGYTELTSKIDKLEKETVRLKDWSAEKNQYEIRQISTGVFAYLAKKHMGEAKNAHKLYCNCFDKTIKATLQQSEKKYIKE